MLHNNIIPFNNAFFSVMKSRVSYYTIINLVRVRYDGLSTRERLSHPRACQRVA